MNRKLGIWLQKPWCLTKGFWSQTPRPNQLKDVTFMQHFLNKSEGYCSLETGLFWPNIGRQDNPHSDSWIKQTNHTGYMSSQMFKFAQKGKHPSLLEHVIKILIFGSLWTKDVLHFKDDLNEIGFFPINYTRRWFAVIDIIKQRVEGEAQFP